MVSVGNKLDEISPRLRGKAALCRHFTCIKLRYRAVRLHFSSKTFREIIFTKTVKYEIYTND